LPCNLIQERVKKLKEYLCACKLIFETPNKALNTQIMNPVTFEVLAVVTSQATDCSLVDKHKSFRYNFCLHLPFEVVDNTSGK
jgi:hypothetical protein